jgi:hypothetical protein
MTPLRISAKGQKFARSPRPICAAGNAGSSATASTSPYSSKTASAAIPDAAIGASRRGIASAGKTPRLPRNFRLLSRQRFRNVPFVLLARARISIQLIGATHPAQASPMNVQTPPGAPPVMPNVPILSVCSFREKPRWRGFD